jgi:hypothetical protein
VVVCLVPGDRQAGGDQDCAAERDHAIGGKREKSACSQLPSDRAWSAEDNRKHQRREQRQHHIGGNHRCGYRQRQQSKQQALDAERQHAQGGLDHDGRVCAGDAGDLDWAASNLSDEELLIDPLQGHIEKRNNQQQRKERRPSPIATPVREKENDDQGKHHGDPDPGAKAHARHECQRVPQGQRTPPRA